MAPKGKDGADAKKTVKKVKDARADKKRSAPNDSNLDEKRIKFLERNRAAATRCREKKKQLMQELRQKASSLTESNSRMKEELAQLQEEIKSHRIKLKAKRSNPMKLVSPLMVNTSMVNTSVVGGDPTASLPVVFDTSSLVNTFGETSDTQAAIAGILANSFGDIDTNFQLG